MKLVRHFLALLLVVSVAMLTGCGGGGGSGSGGSSGTTITTRLLMPAAPSGSLRGSVKGQTSGTTVTGATVTLTMADGTTYTMTDNGNGEYSATVTEVPGAGGFYIEAHKGDLELQNLFTSLPEDLNNLTTDYLSTTFTQVALAFAQSATYGGGVQFASATTLLSNVANISIEFDQLRTEVTDETNVAYTQTRTMFQAALAEANLTTAASGTTLLDQLAAGTLEPQVGNETLSWTEVISTPITQGTFAPPAAAPADDEAAIKTAASTLLNAIAKFYSKTQLSQTEIASISSILSDRFVHRGMTKAIMLNQLALGVSETEDFVLDHFEGDMVLRKINDTTYAVGPVGTVYEKDRDGNIAGQAEDSFKFGYDLSQRAAAGDLFPTIYRANSLNPDEMFPLLVTKETGGWKVVGNGIKVDEIWLNLTNRYEPKAANPGSRTNFWFNVKDTAAFPIKSVTISGTRITSPISLAKNAELADSNTWYYWWTDTNNNNNTYTSGYPNQGWDSAVKHNNGDKYTFVVTFTDDTTQTFEHTIANLPSDWTSLNATVTAGSTGVTATWTANQWNDFEEYYIHVQNMQTSGDNRILEKNIRTATNTTFSFNYTTSAYTLSSGAQIGVNIENHNKWGFSSSYWTFFNVP